MREEVKRMRDDWFECTWIVSGRRSPDADPHIYRCDCSVYYSKPKNNLTAIRGRWRAAQRPASVEVIRLIFPSAPLFPRPLRSPTRYCRWHYMENVRLNIQLLHPYHNGSSNVGNLKLKLFTAVKNNILWQKPFLNLSFDIHTTKSHSDTQHPHSCIVHTTHTPIFSTAPATGSVFKISGLPKFFRKRVDTIKWLGLTSF